MNGKMAIVLHGPQCTGKTTIGEELMKRVPGSKMVILDSGWGWDMKTGQPNIRQAGGADRYADLQCENPLVVVEIGCGEPPDLAVKGATIGADEWVDILRKAGREIVTFRLSCEYAEMRSRLEERMQRDRRNLFGYWVTVGLHKLFELNDPLTMFPASAGLVELPVVTSGKTLEKVAKEIGDTAKL